MDVPPIAPTPMMSPTFSALATALASAQGEIDNASKDAKNPHFGNKYADLASVWEACRGPLSKHGLCVLQPTYMDGGRIVVRTILAHKSGEWIASDLAIAQSKPGPQEMGSVITYLRRYALSAMVGIAPADDDAEQAEGRPPQRQQERQQERPAPRQRREDAPAAAPADAPHDPSWEAARPGFCASLSNPDIDITYDILKSWCIANNRPKPSAMDSAGRAKVLTFLRTDAGRAMIRAHVGGA